MNMVSQVLTALIWLIVAARTAQASQTEGASQALNMPSSSSTEADEAHPDPDSAKPFDASPAPDPKAHLWGAGLGLGLSIGGSIAWKFSTKWSGSFNTKDEGWFGKETYAGGADKLGHMYTDFILGRSLFRLYQAHHYSRQDSIFYAFISGSIARTLMEVADGFTTYHFSYGDLLFNMIGSTSNALLLLDEDIADTFYMSWSYLSSTEAQAGYHDPFDFSTDYSGMVFGLNADIYGLRRMIGSNSTSWSDYTFVGIDYYTRQFRQPDDDKRERFIGVSYGLALHRLSAEDSVIAPMLRFVKLPFTFAGFAYSLDRYNVEVKWGLNYLH